MKNDRSTSKRTFKVNGHLVKGVTDVISTVLQLRNEQLKDKYDQMHAVGQSSWFDEGDEERQAILRIGKLWEGLEVIEVGCGEGDLCAMMKMAGANPLGIDYSEQAISKAKIRHGDWNDEEGITYLCAGYRDVDGFADRVVMQGVLEHLDNPFEELQWMIDHFKPKTVITSSPCFLNTRGVVWHTLNMLGAVMSKTDLHYLDPMDFDLFCRDNGYKITTEHCDNSWGHGQKMVDDLSKRIPLALKDGNIPFKQEKVDELIDWLKSFNLHGRGAVACYRIDISS